MLLSLCLSYLKKINKVERRRLCSGDYSPSVVTVTSLSIKFITLFLESKKRRPSIDNKYDNKKRPVTFWNSVHVTYFHICTIPQL